MTTKDARFWNWMAKGYARRPVADPAAYQHKLDKTATYLKPDMRLLELGCGTGTTALTHSPRVAHIDAVDFSREMIGIARDKAEAQGISNVQFHIGALEDWPAPHPDGTYDMVMTHSLLHLVRDVDLALDLVAANTRPGGLFISSTVCLGDMGGIVKFLLPIGAALGVLPRIQGLTASGLAERIEAHGFEIEYNWRPSPDASVFLVARRK